MILFNIGNQMPIWSIHFIDIDTTNDIVVGYTFIFEDKTQNFTINWSNCGQYFEGSVTSPYPPGTTVTRNTDGNGHMCLVDT